MGFQTGHKDTFVTCKTSSFTHIKTKLFTHSDHELIKITRFPSHSLHEPPPSNRFSHWSGGSKLVADWTISSKTFPSSMAATMSGVDKPSAPRSSSNTTSFQKKTRSKLISIPGSRPSVQNGQLLVSTGVTSLDYLLG